MVKHNNVIPNVHLRKHWQTNVRTWLNQAARKKRRLQTRRAKAAANAPRPLDNLRPTVSCATIRYNHRLRFGRGFTLDEIKAAGLGIQFARSIGIAVDHRRKNRCQETLNRNKERLAQYINKLVLFPRNEKTPVTKAKSGILNDTPKVNLFLFRITKKLTAAPSSTLFLNWSREPRVSVGLCLIASRKTKSIEASDKNGTTKETKAEDKKENVKLPRKNDLFRFI